LGVKSGRGFYDYSHGTKDLVVAPGFSKKQNGELGLGIPS